MHLLEEELYEHPEWIEEVIKTASDAVLKKVKDNRKTDVDIQFAFSMMYENQYGTLSKANRITVNKALLKCDAFKGTPFAQQVKERLEIMEK